MLKPHFPKLILAQMVLFFVSATVVEAQIAMAPLKRLPAIITCHVGGEEYQLTPNRQLIRRMQFAPDDVETQKIFQEVEPYTELRIHIYTIPVKENINVEICPSDEGMNFIAFSADWLQRLYDETATKWALYGVVAHEIAHFVKAHDRTRVGSDPVIELEADRYAGEVLGRMGASFSQARAAYDSDLLRKVHGETHPPIEDRIAAVRQGWLKGKDIRSQLAETSTSSASGIIRGPVESNHSVFRGENEYRFKVKEVQFNSSNSLRKTASEITSALRSHVLSDELYYWTRDNEEDRLLLAWKNVSSREFGWVVIENYHDKWFYKANSDNDWTLLKRGEKTRLVWDDSDRKIEILLRVPNLCNGWTIDDIQYGFGNSADVSN